MEQIILFFTVQVLEKKFVFIFSKYLRGAMNWILNGGKPKIVSILKQYLACKIHYSEYQRVKSMYECKNNNFSASAKIPSGSA